MRKFLFKISFYIIGVIAVLLYLGTYADGNTDDNYMHFTGPKPSNMIIGDSRGVQAVIPDILDQKFKDRKFNNFAFNIADSPYGKIYFEAIKKKLDPNTKNGIFILTVDPWSLTIDKRIKSEKEYSENNSALADMYFYDMAPNYEYLLKHYSRSWFTIYREREELVRSNTYLHKNGWMEVTVDVHPDSLRKREIKKVEGYLDNAKKLKMSSYRMNAFEDMIKYLKNKGSVYIVRIPGFKGIMDIENSYFPDFSKRIEDVAKKNDVKFFDFSSKYDDYIFIDGNHMYKESGKAFTAQIADSILLNTSIRKN